MWSNRENADEALGLAQKKLSEGDTAGAMKWVQKSLHMYETVEAREVERKIQERVAHLAAARRVLEAADRFEVLGVTRAATAAEIKRAFKRLSREVHPDKNGADEAVKAFQRLNEANTTLSDPREREKYVMLNPAGSRRAAAAPPAASGPSQPSSRRAAAAPPAASGPSQPSKKRPREHPPSPSPYDVKPLTLNEATAKLCAHSDTKVRPALDMMQKMVANIAKAPAEAKYRQLRLSNPKVAEGLVFVPGARQYLHAIGWVIGPGAGEVGEDAPKDCISLPLEGDGVAQAAAQQAAVAALVQASNAAVEKRRLDELAARNKEIADKLAKQKAEKEAMKAAMARDRAEVAARGPAQASIAKKLPTESGGTMTSAIFSEQEEAEGRRNAQ